MWQPKEGDFCTYRPRAMAGLEFGVVEQIFDEKAVVRTFACTYKVSLTSLLPPFRRTEYLESLTSEEFKQWCEDQKNIHLAYKHKQSVTTAN